MRYEIQWVARVTPEQREDIENALDEAMPEPEEGAICLPCFEGGNGEVPATTLVAPDDATEYMDIACLCTPCYKGYQKSGDCHDVAAVVHLPDPDEKHEGEGAMSTKSAWRR